MSLLTRILLILTLTCSLVNVNAQRKQNQQQIFKRDNADEYYDESVKQAKLRNYRIAISLAREGLRLRDNFMDLHLLIGKLYTITKNYDSARYHIKYVISNDPRYKDAYFYAINIEASTNKYEEALCFVDDALYFFPNDKEFLLKKLSLLQQTRRTYQSILMADKILDKYPSDAKVIMAFVEHKLVLGRYYMQRGILTQARIHFENALAADPSNREALNALYNIEIRSGNYQAALNRVNYALIRNPNSYDLLMSKVGIQQSMHAYAEALETLRTILRYYPYDRKALAVERELRFEAANYYLSMDPLMQYMAIIEREPGNRDALSRIIGINASRGNDREAMIWVNKGLNLYPDDEILLGTKLEMLELNRNYTEAAAIAERLYRRQPTLAWRNRLVELKIASAQAYATQQIYDTALIEVNRALQLSPNNYVALERKSNILMAQKDYDEALVVVNTMLEIYPNDEKAILRKSTIAEALGNREEAAEITSALVQRDPDNKKINAIYVEQRLAAARALMQQEEFDQAREQLRFVIDLNPGNLEALNYLINLESATKRNDSALYYANLALVVKPNNKELLLKKAATLEALKRYQEAYEITYELMQRYPYNNKIRQTYIDQVLFSGRNYVQRFVYDSAMMEFNKALQIAPKDTTALMYSINLLNDRGLYDSALVLVNRGLESYPQSEYFHLKKAVILESKKDFALAAAHADTAAKINPVLKNVEYALYLKNQSYKNEFGLFFLRSSFDDPTRKSNIATIEYRRYNKRGSFAGRLNYAGRANGTGYQLDAEMYRSHKNGKDNSWAVISGSDGNVFPLLRLSYSFFRQFKSWEGELGARYVKNKSEDGIISFVGSGAKSMGEFWVNLRGFYLVQGGNFYQAYTLTNRYYLNDNNDYLQLLFGLGTTPDDISRNYEIGSVLDFITTTIGATYMKTYRYRNRFLLSFNWINQKVSDGVYRNQYDVYLTYQRRF